MADQLARSLVRPLIAVAHAADRLASGDLSARAAVAGPPEVRLAGNGLNRLATRIGDLLAHERETVADLSHRLRTPLTALRIDAESMRDSRLIDDVAAMERTVSEIIREARRQRGEATGMPCDARLVIAERAAFWRPLAEDQDRQMSVSVPGRSGDRRHIRRRPRGMRRHPAGERLRPYARRRGACRPAQSPGRRRRMAGGGGRRAGVRARRRGAARPVRRWLDRAWPRHRAADCRRVGRDADHRPVGVWRQPGHPRLRPASRIRCPPATATVASRRAGRRSAALRRFLLSQEFDL